MPAQQCTFCNRNFNRTAHLQRHVRSHTKEKPFKCTTCQKGFVREDTLMRHAKSHGIGTGRRMTLSEVSINTHFERSPLSEEQSPDRNLGMNSLQDMPILGVRRGSEGQNQHPTMSPSTAVRPNYRAESDIFDFSNMEAINNQSHLWNFDAADISGISEQASGMQFLAPHYSSNMFVTEGLGRLETTQVTFVPDMREIWFTKPQKNEDALTITSAYSPDCIPPPQPAVREQEQAAVDEEYRQGLCIAFIHPIQPEDSLPSSNFLNLCVCKYLQCFNPIFPLIHKGTFRPTQENGLLFLSMASVGSLFLNSKSALRRGNQLFIKLHKTILGSWENILGRKKGEIFAMVQAVIIGQTFAMLSGNSRLLAIFDAYHGSVISFARRSKLFDAHPVICEVENLTDDELDATWREWAEKEELSRISLALQIHDAEISALFHQEPLLRPLAEKPSQSTSHLFAAATASQWKILAKEDMSPSHSRSYHQVQGHIGDSLAAYVKLEGLGVMIAEDRRQSRLDPIVLSTYEESLLRWYTLYGDSGGEQEHGYLCLMILWHWTFMSLLVDFNQLECAIGRDGPPTEEVLDYVTKWVATPEALRCIMHAFLLQKTLQGRRFDNIPAIHVPRTLFSAAIAWSCYLQYGPDNDILGSSALLFDINLPDFRVLGRRSRNHLSQITSLSWKRGATSSVKAATLCELGQLLNRMNEWGLAGKFSDIVAYLIDAEPPEAIAF